MIYDTLQKHEPTVPSVGTWLSGLEKGKPVFTKE